MPVDVCHNDVRATLVFRNFVNRNDVGVTQCRGRLGLAFETNKHVGIRCVTAGKKLDCHIAVKLGVFGQVHLSHAALTNFFQDFIMGYRFIDHELGRTILALRGGSLQAGRAVVVATRSSRIPLTKQALRSILPAGSGCSAGRLAHLLWEQGVGGSNPLTPTNFSYKPAMFCIAIRITQDEK